MCIWEVGSALGVAGNEKKIKFAFYNNSLTKQNIQENFQVKYIKKYIDIPILIQSKTKGLRFQYKNEETNSIDALIGDNIFVMLKLISKDANGGSQNEQRDNIEKWIRIASIDLIEQGKQNTTKLIAIMDDNNPRSRENFVINPVDSILSLDTI